MASIYDIKPAFQRLLRPLLQGLVYFSITPNQVTASAIALSVVGGILVFFSQQVPLLLLVVPLILLIRMALNALDGMLAREYAQGSPLGEILNEVGDIISDTVLYLPLMVLFYPSLQTVLLLALFILLACLSEFCGVLAKAMTTVRQYEGPMGKSDRAFAISVLAIALYCWPVFVHQSSTYFFILLDALLVLSCFNRLKSILSQGIPHA